MVVGEPLLHSTALVAERWVISFHSGSNPFLLTQSLINQPMLLLLKRERDSWRRS